MRHWIKSCGMLAFLGCSWISSINAADAIVQDFDGWKITIQSGPASSSKNPTPSPERLVDGPLIIPASFNPPQPGPAPEGVSPPPAPMPPPGPASPPAPGLTAVPTDDGLPIITPGESSQCCDSKTVVSPPEGTVDPRYISQAYLDIYKSIPFIRAEYDANPSYIHDTAVEFAFGKMRQTTMVRGTINVNQNSPYAYGGYRSQYGYGGYGYDGYGFGGYPFGLAYPPLQLVVPGTGLRIHRSY